MTKTWTKEEIKELILTNDIMLYRALKKMYDLQTEDEKLDGETKHENGVGFNGFDAKFMTSLAEFLIKNRYLTNKQKEYARKKMLKYVGQLTRIANERGN